MKRRKLISKLAANFIFWQKGQCEVINYLLPPPNAFDNAQITIAITATTRMTPVQTPPLKMPPTTSQLVSVTVNSKTMRKLMYAFM